MSVERARWHSSLLEGCLHIQPVCLNKAHVAFRNLPLMDGITPSEGQNISKKRNRSDVLPDPPVPGPASSVRHISDFSDLKISILMVSAPI